MAALDDELGFAPKYAGFQSTMSASLPGASVPTCARSHA
jgi:hypothetical protein